MKCAVEHCPHERLGPVWCPFHASHQTNDRTAEAAEMMTWSFDRDQPGCDMWANYKGFTYHIQLAGEFYYYSIMGKDRDARAQGRVKYLAMAKRMCELFAGLVA